MSFWCGDVGWVEGDEVEGFGGLKDGEEVAVADVDVSGEEGVVVLEVVLAVVDCLDVDVGGDDVGSVVCAGECDDAAACAEVEGVGVWLWVYVGEEEVGVFGWVVDVGVDLYGEVLVVEVCWLWCIHGGAVGWCGYLSAVAVFWVGFRWMVGR